MSHHDFSWVFDLAPQVDYWSARFVDSRSEELCVRQNLLQPPKTAIDSGVMVTIYDKGGYAYVACPDTSKEALARAFALATNNAHANARFALFDPSTLNMPAHQARYERKAQIDWHAWTMKHKMELIENASHKLKSDARIVDWEASLWFIHMNQMYLSKNGAQIEQRFDYIVPNLSATAHENGVTQTRTLNGRGICRQNGLELVDQIGFIEQAKQIASEAIELVLAPNCPSGEMDLLLAPDQMMLQIHESIGHPLELDRILGDERNYAGTSFVTLDMFGKYQYGSSLLNITYDPTIEEQFASFAFDDDGVKAEKTFVIKDGILTTPLGSYISQTRANMSGVANSRAASWNRAPIDRMANLNLEPGATPFEDMLKSIERGIYMKTNTSWSIDDSRNKFQFGCEWAQLIEKGRLTKVVRNANYRGISATFWRNLKAVGDRSTFEILGTPFCGKGEPNQCIRVGHASPPCLFANVAVFGGV